MYACDNLMALTSSFDPGWRHSGDIWWCWTSWGLFWSPRISSHFCLPPGFLFISSMLGLLVMLAPVPGPLLHCDAGCFCLLSVLDFICGLWMVLSGQVKPLKVCRKIFFWWVHRFSQSSIVHDPWEINLYVDDSCSVSLVHSSLLTSRSELVLAT